jgi:hypothetical protein
MQHELFYQPQLLRNISGIRVAESTRHGGVSPAPFASLNLGINTQDSDEHVWKNRNLLSKALEIHPESWAYASQVHEDRIAYVEAPGKYEGYDALICGKNGPSIGVQTADCTPILIYDTQTGARAAIHAGWRGTIAKIAYKTLVEMQRRFGTDARECLVYIGTCIDASSFQVGEEVAQHFSPELKTPDTAEGKYLVDLKKANALQLLDLGVPEQHIEISSFCTIKHNDRYFSHRLENGITGRMMTLIGAV